MMKVAVIGAGAAGLCALRHLTARPNLFKATAYELTSQVGGTWVYNEQIGQDDTGMPIHSSMYTNLHTNLPKEVMAFPDFPFDKSLPSFVHHSDVLRYLNDYAEHYDLLKHIEFNTNVMRVHPVVEGGELKYWSVTTKSLTPPGQLPGQLQHQTFDAVMVCNGHYSQPVLPKLAGLEGFRGEVIHSHNYRHREVCRGRSVVCLGAGASGQDIALEVATVANKVYLSHNKPQLEAPLPANMEQVAGIDRLTPTSAILKDGSQIHVDFLLLCTGYHYTFPFLTPECKIGIKDERVLPLYKHLINIDFPSLCLMGLCKTICPFPQFDCQVRFMISSLDGSMVLPSVEEMRKDTQRDFDWRREELNMPARYAHTMGTLQWGYNDELAYLGDFTPIPDVVRMLYDAVHTRRRTDLVNYKKDNFALLGPKKFKSVSTT